MAEVNLLCSVRTNGGDLYIRSGPSLAHNIIGFNRNGTSNLHATQEESGWYYLVDYGGWSSGDWLSIDQNLGDSVDTPNEEDVTSGPSEEEVNRAQESAQISSFLEGSVTNESVNNLMSTTLEGIYGIPYQFMSTVDPKLDGTSYGQIYSDKIISRIPLLLLAPGKVNFTRTWRDDSESALLLQGLVDSEAVNTFSETINSGGRYYTFDEDYVGYYRHVEAMCMAGAYFLGIQDVPIEVGGETVLIKDVKWENAGKNSFKEIMSDKAYIAFYVDSASQVSESFDNSTSESQLASKVNSFSDAGRELNFLLGSTTGKTWIDDYGDSAAIESAMQTVNDIADQYLHGSKLFEDIGKNFATIAVGGKLIFPEIWSDSSYSRSYDVNIKLRTPDGDKLSWFMNIYVPLAHLVCLTAPKESSSTGPNGYTTPYLIRAFYKGLFNCDMGIITSLDITRGKEKAWTVDQLPTEVDVSVQIKDLYNMMTLSDYTQPGSFVNNIALMDYIANTCGININEPDIQRSVEIYCMLTGHNFRSIIPDMWSQLQQNVNNRIMSTQEGMTKFLGLLDKIPGL